MALVIDDSMRPNMPGLSVLVESRNSHVARNVPLVASTTGAMRATVPSNDLLRQRVDAKMHGLAGLERVEIALGHVQHGLQRIHVDDLEQCLVDRDEIAELDRALGDHAGNRREDARVGKIDLRAFDDRVLRFQIELVAIEIGARDQVLRDALLGLVERGLRLLQGRLGLHELVAHGVVVELREQLALLDAHALLDHELQDDAAGLRDDLGIADRFECRGAG